jgi:hypothetical protein
MSYNKRLNMLKKGGWFGKLTGIENQKASVPEASAK